MIGVVGPRDSVAQVVAVAEEMANDTPIMTRTYGDPASIEDHVRELDRVCSVILFTGRVPYAIASARVAARARMEYIPHEGVDLMRVVARMLIGHSAGEPLPRVSVDSMEAYVAREVFAELGFPAAEIKPIPLVLQDRGSDFDAAAIAGQHLELLDEGAIDVCLTCLDSVHQRLQRQKAPVIRVTHAQMVVRAALERCALAHELARAAGSQVAVLMLASRSMENVDARKRALFDSLVRDAASAVHSDVHPDSDTVVKLVTTRGAVEHWLGGLTQTRPKLLEADFVELVDVGVGLGETIALAERHARRALSFSSREGQPFLFTAEGQSISLGRTDRSYRARDTRAEMLTLARRLNLSAVSLQRLVFALQQSDSSRVTAGQLAVGYGVAPRSARRLLTTLVGAGLAEPVGTEQGPKAGRPQTVFRVHLDRLLALAGTPDPGRGGPITESVRR